MTSFAVYGVSKHKIREGIRKRTPIFNKKTQKMIPEREWNQIVEEKAEKAFNKEKPRISQISERFDAPQFCERFLELANKNDHRFLEIRHVYDTEDAKGRKVKRWQAYEGKRK